MERQLGLFKGKQQRGVQRPKPRELVLHFQVAEVLRFAINLGWIYTHMPMGEKRDLATAIKLKRMGMTKGWPDFAFFGPRRQCIWLELKRSGERPSEEQEIRMQQLRACGHTVLYCDNFEAAIDLLRDHGIVRAVT